MRHIRMLGLCLVAALALGAYAVSSASALPEWGKCEAKAHGKYSDANCTVKAARGAGSFEWRKGKAVGPVKFSGANVGSGGVLSSTLEQCANEKYEYHRIPRSKCVGGIETLKASIECESETNTGETFGASEVRNVLVTFRGCKLFGSTPCENQVTEGEVVVDPLKGKLGYINKAEKKVGLLLEPSKKHGEFANFHCYHLGVGVGVGSTKEGAFYKPEKTGGYDGIISPITPVNTMTNSYTQTYTINPETNENIPSKFEGKHIELLESYDYNTTELVESLWAAAGEEITNVNTPAEEGEIKA